VNDPVFIAAGLQVSEDARGNDPSTVDLEAADAFFGVEPFGVDATHCYLWGTAGIKSKRAEIRILIAPSSKTILGRLKHPIRRPT
jgi:hypothetical protein